MNAGSLFLVVAAVGMGQSGFRSQGYFVGGVSGYSGSAFTRQTVGGFAGGGGTWQVLGSRFGAGGDVRALWPGIAIGSVDGTLRLGASSGSKAQPFVAGGYSFVLGGDASGNAGNIGGGLDLWVRERTGVRFEVRDTLIDYGFSRRRLDHYWTVGVGLVGR